MRWGMVIAVAAASACRCGSPAAVVASDGGPAAAALDAGPAGAAGAPAGAVLEQARGAVELQRRGGGWTAAVKGERIAEQDGLRTPPGALAVVAVDGARVTLHDRSELRLTTARPGRLAARIHGRAEGDVAPGKARVSLQVDDAGSEAQSEGGHFVVTAEGKTVAIAATAGAVQVSTGSKKLELKGGEVLTVGDGLPEQPVAALQKVLLTVAWPGEKTNRSSVPIAGRVEAGSRVYVQGQPVEVAPTGEFHTDVRLRDGRQSIAVVTIDPLGRRKSQETEVIRDSTPPQVKMTPPWR